MRDGVEDVGGFAEGELLRGMRCESHDTSMDNDEGYGEEKQEGGGIAAGSGRTRFFKQGETSASGGVELSWLSILADADAPVRGRWRQLRG